MSLGHFIMLIIATIFVLISTYKEGYRIGAKEAVVSLNFHRISHVKKGTGIVGVEEEIHCSHDAKESCVSYAIGGVKQWSQCDEERGGE